MSDKTVKQGKKISSVLSCRDFVVFALTFRTIVWHIGELSFLLLPVGIQFSQYYFSERPLFLCWSVMPSYKRICVCSSLDFPVSHGYYYLGVMPSCINWSSLISSVIRLQSQSSLSSWSLLASAAPCIAERNPYQFPPKQRGNKTTDILIVCMLIVCFNLWAFDSFAKLYIVISEQDTFYLISLVMFYIFHVDVLSIFHQYILMLIFFLLLKWTC